MPAVKDSDAVDNLVTGTGFLASGPLALPPLKLVQLNEFGPIIIAEIEGPSMYEICKVGREELIGEVIWIEDNRVTIQVHEEIGMQAKYLLYNES